MNKETLIPINVQNRTSKGNTSLVTIQEEIRSPFKSEGVINRVGGPHFSSWFELDHLFNILYSSLHSEIHIIFTLNFFNC